MQTDQTISALPWASRPTNGTGQVRDLAAARRKPDSQIVAYLGLFLFLSIYYIRPNDWIPGVETFPFAKVAAIVAIMGLLASLMMKPRSVLSVIKQSPVLKGLLLLYGWMYLTVPTAFWRTGTLVKLAEEYWKFIVIVILIVVAVNSVSRLRKLLVLSVLCMSVQAVATIYGYLHGQTTLTGRAQGMLFQGAFRNPNELALNFVTLTPLALALAFGSRGLLSRLWWLACTGVLVLGVIVSFSRGGFLAFLVTAFYIFWGIGVKSKRQSVIALGLLFAIVAAIYFVPSGYQQRIAGIVDPHSDSSAEQRQNLFWRSLYLTITHPVFGLGSGNFDEVSGVWRGTHNTYTQVSSENGIPGLIIFIWILAKASQGIKNSIRAAYTTNNTKLQLLTWAMRACFAGLLVGLFFYHAQYEFLMYFPLGYAVALKNITQQEAAESAALEKQTRTDASGKALQRVLTAT